MPEAAAIRGEYGIGRHAPWMVLAVSLLVTLLLWQSAVQSAIQEQRIEFEFRVSDISDRIHRRITYYEQVLHGVRAFYLNQHSMERGEFGGYISALAIEKNFPGIQAISFAPLISDAGKSAHVGAMRRSGLPAYAIKPEGRRPAYAPVAYIEPLNERNARVLGFDNLSSPTRKATIERARDEDRAIISEMLVLKQEAAQAPQVGFLMFLPAFRRDAAHGTVAARRENMAGWFAAAFRMDDLLDGALERRAEGIDIGIFDGGAASEPFRMYGVPRYEKSLYSVVVPIEIAGHSWTMQLSSLPEFEEVRDGSGARNTAIAGVLLSLLLSAVTWLLMRDRMRALYSAQAIGRELEMRKLAEHKTRDLHMFNEAILEKSPSGIAVFMANGPCVMANEAYARAIGGTVDEVLQQDFSINASWRRNGLFDYANQALASGLAIRRDIEGETSFGKKVVVECTFAPINVSGNPHLLLIVNDVSDRAEARRALTDSMQQLEEKELAKTRFLAAAGHDLRQPVAAASLFIDALKLTESTQHQQEIIKRLDQSMATFNGLLDALLNVSKLDAGMIKPEYTSINVAEIFNWLEQNFAPMASEKGLGFRLYFPMREALVLRSDIGLVKSILMNLVSNAVKFTPGGAILVSARRRGGSVLLQVWDSGPGIPPEHIEHVFDEFYQINNPQRERSSGLGLGLAIVKRALTLLGSKVICRSRVGQGTVFEFRLPLDASPDERLPKAGDAKEQPDVVNESFAQGKRFVVVEDDALVAQGMVNWLEGMGGEVKCFHSAEDALRHANIDYADYFIADYMLGGAINGIQFLNMVRHKLGKPINAVLVTGDTSAAFIRHAVDCDWLVLHKPINTSKLISALSAQGLAPKPGTSS
ncbi:MAG: CHASE domain-containing protein [Nitrosomonadales bacterium]|nr:CHASE domain-containing protein [Nitrosomonadales bacterium]